MRLFCVILIMMVSLGWDDIQGSDAKPICATRPQWTDLQKEIESVLQKQQPMALSWEAGCLVPQTGPVPVHFGTVLFRYVWSVISWQQAAIFFDQPLSDRYEQQVHVLRSLCFEKFQTQCGRFLKYREKLLDQNSLD